MFYFISVDTTNELEAKCQWLASFGKTKQLMPSLLAYQTEASISQSDMDHQVQELVESELPRLQRCRQRKVNAILVEARSKVAVYKSALGAHQEAVVKAKGMQERVCLTGRGTLFALLSCGFELVSVLT